MVVIKSLWKLKLNNYYLVFFLFFAITSCSIYGITNDYGKLNNKQKEIIHPLTDFKSAKENNIYEINGLQLKEELKKNDRSVVVLFANGCNSKRCIPLSGYRLFSEKVKAKLYLVMVGYDNLDKTLEQNIGLPLFSIDNKYYKTIFKEKYIDKFILDLVGPQPEFHTIYMFKKDSLVTANQGLFNLIKSKDFRDFYGKNYKKW